MPTPSTQKTFVCVCVCVFGGFWVGKIDQVAPWCKVSIGTDMTSLSLSLLLLWTTPSPLLYYHLTNQTRVMQHMKTAVVCIKTFVLSPVGTRFVGHWRSGGCGTPHVTSKDHEIRTSAGRGVLRNRSCFDRQCWQHQYGCLQCPSDMERQTPRGCSLCQGCPS